MGKSENKKNNFYGKLVIIALLVISIGSSKSVILLRPLSA